MICVTSMAISVQLELLGRERGAIVNRAWSVQCTNFKLAEAKILFLRHKYQEMAPQAWSWEKYWLSTVQLECPRSTKVSLELDYVQSTSYDMMFTIHNRVYRPYT